MLQSIAAFRAWCSHPAIGASFAGLVSPELFFGACPCSGHIAPSQQPMPAACKAEAQAGAHSSITATKHTHAPNLLPGALESWRILFILRISTILHLSRFSKFNLPHSRRIHPGARWRDNPETATTWRWESYLQMIGLGALSRCLPKTRSKDLPHMRAVPEKPATMQLALSSIVPLVVGVCATQVTMAIGERYGRNILPLVLVGWCVALFVSAAYLNHVLFRRARTLLPFLAALVVILLIWLWQRQAFTMLVPRSGLTYGYFLKPEGTKAGFWVLTCPLLVGFTCLSVCFITALVSGWRVGVRRSLTCMMPWWLAAFLIFALPSMYLDAQGNASVFI
jgi:hypothetical protein